MKLFDEGPWWLPDAEAHLQAWMLKVGDRHPAGGRLLYQGHKYRMATAHCQARRVAVDVGAHVGLWSWQMAHDFNMVVAFEPVLAHRACWLNNMRPFENAVLRPFALGAEPGSAAVSTRTPDSTGDTGVDPDPPASADRVLMETLDSLHLANVDFLKVDCEGYELFVLKGAEETLLRCRPCVIVEQKPETGMAERYGIGETDAVRYLESLGARKRAALQGDYVMSWDPPA